MLLKESFLAVLVIIINFLLILIIAKNLYGTYIKERSLKIFEKGSL